jgi:hypothetical protein
VKNGTKKKNAVMYPKVTKVRQAIESWSVFSIFFIIVLYCVNVSKGRQVAMLMKKPFAVNVVNGTCKVLSVCVQACRLETPKVLAFASKPCPKNVLE